MTERKQALEIAAKVLESDGMPPHEDVIILARQLLLAKTELDKMTVVAFSKRI